MYCIKVYGCPGSTTNTHLQSIRDSLIKELAEVTGVSPATIRPFFIKDQVGDPGISQDTTILVELDPGMFTNWLKLGKYTKEKIFRTVAEILQTAYNGEYGIKVIIVSSGEVKEIPPVPRSK